ncbi:unnamed protein product [Discula destructiva]
MSQANYIFCHFYNLAIASTKLSVLALYHRIFVSPGTPHFRIVVLATAVFVAAWLVVLELILGLECRPVQAWWGGAAGVCADLVAIGYFTNITNLVLDMWIFAIPLPTLLGMHASRSKRLGLCFLFSVGLGTCGISAARLTFVVAFASPDVTWSQVPLGILSAWECCGGVLCANLPIVYKTIHERIKSTIISLRIISREAFSSSKSPRSVWTGTGGANVRVRIDTDSDRRSVIFPLYDLPAAEEGVKGGKDESHIEALELGRPQSSAEVDVDRIQRVQPSRLPKTLP